MLVFALQGMETAFLFSDFLDRISRQRVLVIGDLILDRFVRGATARISPEAPVVVVDVDEVTSHLGGAANVAHNACPFVNKVGILGVIGVDDAGYQLESLLTENNIIENLLIRDETQTTPLKTRVVAGSQQVVRFDQESVRSVSEEVEKKVIDRLSTSVGSYDCVVVADYAKGLLTDTIVNRLRELVAEGVMVAVDPHIRNLVDWRGLSVMKPNYMEACKFAGLALLQGSSDLNRNHQQEQLVRILEKKWEAQHLLITMGSRGMLYANSNGQRHHEIATPREAFDVSGAGDTVSVLFALALSAGADCEYAVRLANCAAGIVVEKTGTTIISPKELGKRMEQAD